MNEIDDKILTRLKKLQALAERGVGGEKLTAQKKLNELLKANNLDLESLNQITPQFFLFKYTNEHAFKLLTQIMYKVVSPSLPKGEEFNCYKAKGTRNKVGIYCTPAQKLEIELDYEFYMDLFNQEVRSLLVAFIQKQNIFPVNSPVTSLDPSNMSKQELDDLRKIQQYASNINYANRSLMIDEG